MSINFIPNDPLVRRHLPMQQKNPRPDRPANLAGFTYSGDVPEGKYSFGTPEFLFWQCREAALAALEAWEMLDGKLRRWANQSRMLRLLQNHGNDLNAYYDRRSLSFFEYTTGNKTTYSGASTDVVAHEAGHALLDAIKPDLWNSYYFEVSSFHEAFGDCMALLTALADQQTRAAVLRRLKLANFVEATAEDLADGVRREYGKDHPAAVPRHAHNNFKWQFPDSLPLTGPPGVLIREVHVFGQVFSGCFFDVLRNIFASLPNQNEAALWTAAETAGKLLIEAARMTPPSARFFREVGRAMILADQNPNNGMNHLAIRNAFARHDIALGSSAMLAPIAGLAGAAPKLRARVKGSRLAQATRSDLLRRIGAPLGAKMAVSVLNIAGEQVAQVVHKREVPLDKLDRRLKGVVAIAAEPTLVGAIGERSAILGGLPEPNTTTDEVMWFVGSLLKHDCIDFGKKKSATGAKPQPKPLPTHAVRTRGEKKILTRIRFACPHNSQFLT